MARANTWDPLSPSIPADMDGDRLDDSEYEESAACPPRVLLARTLGGYRVHNQESEELGRIEEILLDASAGVIVCAIVSLDGVPDTGKKLFPIPWAAFRLDSARQRFVLNVDPEKLRDAPNFPVGNWPDMADPQWAADVFGYYGHEPYWKTA